MSRGGGVSTRAIPAMLPCMIAVGVIISTGGCDKSTTAPSATHVTKEVQVEPPPGPPSAKFLITGRVTEQAFDVRNASVRVASPTETFTARTDFAGRYRVTAAEGDVVLTVEQEGYTTHEQRVTVHGQEVVNVELRRSDPSALGGVYTLTMTASSSCNGLPALAMQRAYVARITEYSDTYLIVDLAGARFSGFASAPGFSGKRDGDAVRFDVTGSDNSEFSLKEALTSSTFLAYTGTAGGTFGRSGVVATLDGTIEYSVALRPGLDVNGCKASDHRMEFVRPGA